MFDRLAYIERMFESLVAVVSFRPDGAISDRQS
jgi:hypothetical protein